MQKKNMVTDRLISLGFSVVDSSHIDIALDEGFPEDSLLMLEKPEYTTIISDFILTSGFLYRAQLIKKSEMIELQNGGFVQFDNEYKAFSKHLHVAESFLEPYGDTPYAALLRFDVTQANRVLDIGSLLDVGRWLDYNEVWANFGSFCKKDIIKII